MISIILPTYNEKENIEKLILEILRTVGNSIEIVVVDDYSPDRTWEIVEKITHQHSNVKLILRKNIRGLASAVAEGIQNAKGDILVWMDCDFSNHPH